MNNNFNSYIEEFRSFLIKNILSERIYHSVEIRIGFYYANATPYPPEESCLAKISRELFSDYPPPYHYDYQLQIPSHRSFDEMIYVIRKNYGYSYRRSSKYGSSRSRLSKKQSIKVSTLSTNRPEFKDIKLRSYTSYTDTEAFDKPTKPIFNKNKINPTSSVGL